MDDRLAQIKDTVVTGGYKEIEALVQQAIDEGADLDEVINRALIAAMDVVGRRFGAREIFVPEMLASAATMKKGLDIIKPLLTGERNQSKGKIMICTVNGDIHDIGKNLVVMMLEGAGFEVVDLGVNVSAEMVVEEVRQGQPDVLGMSALLTTTMPEMQSVIALLKKNEIRDRVKVMVGGAPLDADFAQKIGADGYGKDAAQAVELAGRLMANH